MPRFSANISTLFPDLPFLDRFAAAREAGFRAVEIQVPYALPAEDVAAARRKAGVGIALINFPVGDFYDGGPGLAAMPGHEAEFRAAVETGLRYALELRPRSMNVLAGAPPAALGRERCMETLALNLRHAATVMAEAGVAVTVEAVNPIDRPGFFLTTTADALAAIDWADHPNLKAQYDIYHMQIVEGDLTRTLETHIGRIGHIQFADVPGRGEPGTGEINFTHLFETIDRLDYADWVGAEYVPTAATGETLGWFRPHRRAQRWRARRGGGGETGPEIDEPARTEVVIDEDLTFG